MYTPPIYDWTNGESGFGSHVKRGWSQGTRGQFGLCRIPKKKSAVKQNFQHFIHSAVFMWHIYRKKYFVEFIIVVDTWPNMNTPPCCHLSRAVWVFSFTLICKSTRTHFETRTGPDESEARDKQFSLCVSFFREFKILLGERRPFFSRPCTTSVIQSACE